MFATWLIQQKYFIKSKKLYIIIISFTESKSKKYKALAHTSVTNVKYKVLNFSS